MFSDAAAAVTVVVSLIINLSLGFNRKLLSSKLTKRWSVWCFSNCHQKEQLFAFSDSIQTNSNSIMFFYPSNYDGKVGLIPSNTQGFPVFMKSVSKTVDFSTLRWWSITLQESFSKQFIKYPSLFTSHPNTSFVHIKSNRKDLCYMVPALLASFKNSHITLQSWLMGFLLFFWQRFLK